MAPHAPTPRFEHDVFRLPKLSSMSPLQLLSSESHRVSTATGCPVVESSSTVAAYEHTKPAVPLHTGAAPAQTPAVRQKLAGGVTPSSTIPLQLSSSPLHTSVGPRSMHAYSHPFA